jgi:hypothetical protein
MADRTVATDQASERPARGASARERALRFNRGMIGLCVAALLALWLLPIGP